MAIIRFKCTVCKREVEIPENKNGLEIIDRCVITSGCRGSLYRIDRKQDFIRGEFPPSVAGLTDWSARRALYNHEQTVRSSEWRIVHNMGVSPSVQVLIDRAILIDEEADVPCEVRSDLETFEQIETLDFSVEIVSRNELIIRFENPESGFAQLIARSTAREVAVTAVEEEDATFQLTNNSLLTVATLNSTISSSISFDIDVNYIPPGETLPITKTYTVGTGLPNVNSPWNDFNNIIVDGRRYKVRTFDTFVSEFADGTIGDGSSFYFGNISATMLGSPVSRLVNPREIFILLALSPYSNVDKVFNRIVDIQRVTASNAELAFFQQDNELFAFQNIITSVFPPIREVT